MKRVKCIIKHKGIKNFEVIVEIESTDVTELHKKVSEELGWLSALDVPMPKYIQ